MELPVIKHVFILHLLTFSARCQDTRDARFVNNLNIDGIVATFSEHFAMQQSLINSLQQQLEEAQAQIASFNLTRRSAEDLSVILIHGRTRIHALDGYQNQTHISVRLGGRFPDQWDYENEYSAQKRNFEFFSDFNLQVLKDIEFESLAMESDLVFRMQADDSTNPSSVSAYGLDSHQEMTFTMGAGGNHATVYLESEFAQHQLTCSRGGATSGSTACGQRNLPADGQKTEPLILLSATMDPQGSGSSASSNQWSRNQYTVTGSHYHIWLTMRK